MNPLQSDRGPSFDRALSALRQMLGDESGLRELDAADVAATVTSAIVERVDAFGASGNPRVLPMLAEHVEAQVSEYLRLLDGAVVETPGQIERFAREAAEQYFPLEALLHAHRVLVQQLLDITAARLAGPKRAENHRVAAVATRFLLEFIDAASTGVTEHYLDQSRLLADVASDQRSELLGILLGGYDESDRRVAAILRDAGYLDRRLRFCVVLAQSIDPAEMQSRTRARRLADSIDQLLAHLPGNRLVEIHRNKATIIFSHQHRLSGWSRPAEPLSSRVAREMLKIGPAARLGVSLDVESTAQIPAAYRQASIAFDASSVGQRVVCFGDLPLQRLLLQFAREEFSRVLPEWVSSFESADAKSRRRLSKTLQVYADCNLNLLQTARRLRLHANTVYARFDRVRKITDRDPRQYSDLNELLIVIAMRE